MIPDLVCATEYRYRIDSTATVNSEDLSASSPVASFVTAPCEEFSPTAMALTPAPAPAAAITGASTAGLADPIDRWVKPVASAIWWNDDAQRWDAILPRGNGEHWLVTGFTDASPTFALRLDTRAGSRPDVAWNETTNDLFVHFTSKTTPTMWRLRYASGAYTVVTSAVTVPGMRIDDESDGANNHPSTMYQTPNGDLWVAVLYAGNLNLQRSRNLGATWLAAPIVVDNTIPTSGGVVAMADIVEGGNTQLLVFASENKSGRWLAYRINQNATNLSAGNWTNESAALPAWVGGERSDDHLSVRSYNNRVYVGFKTEGAAQANEPLMGLLVRQPGGNWSRYTSFFTDDGHRETRPGVVIDETNQDVYLFYDMINSPNNGAYKKVPISSLGSLTSATETQVFTQGIHSNVLTSHHTITSTSNLAVISESRSNTNIDRAVIESPPVPPVISGRNVTVTATTATVNWQTDVIATSRVDYGLTNTYGFTVSDATPVTSHQLSLVGLACNTTYRYQITSAASPSGATAVTPNATFTTAACLPVISNVQVAPTVNSASVTWTTDLASSSTVDFGLTSAYGSTATGPGSVTSHVVQLNGLACSTTYHFAVSSKTAQSAPASSPNATFTTAACINTQPPVISNVQVAPTVNSASVTWTTDLASSSTVDFGLTSAYGSTATGPGSVTSHVVQLNGLACSTTYHFAVSSKTAQSAPASSPNATFTTAACVNTQPPIQGGASATQTAVRGQAQRYP